MSAYISVRGNVLDTADIVRDGDFATLEERGRVFLVSNNLRGLAKWHEPASPDLSRRLRCALPHQRRQTSCYMAVAENGCRGLRCSELHTFRASRMDIYLFSTERATWLTNYLKRTSPIAWAMSTIPLKYHLVDASLIVASFQEQSWTKKANST